MLYVREEGSTTIERYEIRRNSVSHIVSRVPLQLPMVMGSVGTV